MEKNKDNTPGFTAKDKGDISLVEIGPRFCMSVIRIFEGSFGGPTVFENPEFVHPNYVRATGFFVFTTKCSMHYFLDSCCDPSRKVGQVPEPSNGVAISTTAHWAGKRTQ